MSIKNEVYTIVGLGEILWDLFPKGKQFSGAPANFAYHVSALVIKELLQAILEKMHLEKKFFIT
ncbi:MAG: hypothetical protein L6305_08510 [Actinomycetia bacterium]|nr:hypothetical protein [Actinomycetes bacterium]